MQYTAGATYQSIVGGVITTWRKERELTQGQLADLMGMSQSAWSRIEQGVSNISVEQLSKVARHLNVAPHMIVERSDRVRERLLRDNIAVSDSKEEAVSSGWLLLGAAALAAVILASS